MENVLSVHDEMRKRGITCYGYHYRAAENTHHELDESLVQFQLDYLYKHEIWLSEREAAAIMLKNTSSL